MKKILKNKKGFTLVELLAVIVVLAIIMVIATQQVGKAINNARANSFVESYQMIVKQANLFMSQDETVECSGLDACLSYYNLSNDYTLTITKDDSARTYTITLGITDNGKFKNLNLDKYGKYIDGSSCSKAKVGSNATSCSGKTIIGKIPY